MDAKHEIVKKAGAVVLVASVLSAACYGLEISLATQTPAVIGIDPSAALVAVSALAAVIVGLVLAEKPTILRSEGPGNRSIDRPGQAEMSTRTQGSVLIISETLLVVSIFTAFIGIGALVNAVQATTKPNEASFQALEMASIVAGIAWVFVLLASASTKSPAEVMALATVERERFDVGARHRQSWQSTWISSEGGSSNPRTLNDASLKWIQKETGAPARRLAWVITFVVFALFYASCMFSAVTGSLPTEVNALIRILVTAPLVDAALFAIGSRIVWSAMERALVAARNGQRGSRAKWLSISVGCLLSLSIVPALAFGFWAAAVVQSAILVSAWSIQLRSPLTILKTEIGQLPSLRNSVAGLAALNSAAKAEIRDFPLPTEPAPERTSHFSGRFQRLGPVPTRTARWLPRGAHSRYARARHTRPS
ncbi:hypothetical protein KIV56_00905 [Cryobacterium breve]|uniref:Uncharacterized protein n=1 Tax=Cryobacterium breve TaxID=1259258 RepID=A0ABY7NEZ4_9MICO|nr:hypothetical protein [Cryobacterium breve]WBM80180.1 hypothetical protein KIV56_00905 [Cryobacterium breve]